MRCRCISRLGRVVRASYRTFRSRTACSVPPTTGTWRGTSSPDGVLNSPGLLRGSQVGDMDGRLSVLRQVAAKAPKTNCDTKSVDLAYVRFHDAIRTARMCRVRKGSGMAKLVFGMNQSLDGYVDHLAFAPSPTLFRHFIEEAQGQAGSVYGRQMYEVMRYWDDDHPEWNAEDSA